MCACIVICYGNVVSWGILHKQVPYCTLVFMLYRYLVPCTEQQEVGLAGGTGTCKDTMKGRSMVLSRNLFPWGNNSLQWDSVQKYSIRYNLVCKVVL